MMGIVWLDEMQLQLQLLWLLQPASLLQLLQRPVWLDAWVHGEEERASLLWRGLPNHVILHILKLRTINKWKPKFDCVLLHLKLRVANIKVLRAREREMVACGHASSCARAHQANSGVRIRERDRTLWVCA